MLKPFIYLSEQLVTQRNNIEVIVKCALNHGYTPDEVLLNELWQSNTLSTKAQLQKYRMLGTGFKNQSLRNWHFYLVDQLLPGILGPSSLKTSDSALAQDISKCLSDPKNYYVPSSTLKFIQDLEQNELKWGIIANDDHLYPLSVKYLGLKPFKIISARQNVFKPLPIMFENAWSKVPSSMQSDVWFIGDAKAPYDNITSRFMRTAMLGDICDKSSTSRLRISCFEDIYEELGLTSSIELVDFDMGAKELRPFLELPKNKILERGERDVGLVDVKER